MLAKSGLTSNTRTSYNTYFPYWEEFCEWMDRDLPSLTENAALDFVKDVKKYIASN